MKKLQLLIVAAVFIFTLYANAQIKLNTRSFDAAKKGTKSFTYTDEDAANQAGHAVEWMDAHNPVAAENDKYTTRLKKIFAAHSNEDGLVLNFKVYKVVDINAFACAD